MFTFEFEASVIRFLPSRERQNFSNTKISLSVECYSSLAILTMAVWVKNAEEGMTVQGISGMLLTR